MSENNGELYAHIVCGTIFRMTPHGTEEIVNLEGIKQQFAEAIKEFPYSHDDHIYGKKFVDAWLTKWFGDLAKPIVTNQPFNGVHFQSSKEEKQP